MMLATMAAGPSSNPVQQGSPSNDAKRCELGAEAPSSKSRFTPTGENFDLVLFQSCFVIAKQGFEVIVSHC